jgi:beta-glucosidase
MKPSMHAARLLLAVLIPLSTWGAQGAPDLGAPIETRVEALIGRMTLDEKVLLLSGVDIMDIPANERLGIPRLKMTDGPLGVRTETGEKTTAFPSGILSASSFDPELLGELASAMAMETLALGRDMLLGPCINIARVPQGGRNFESFGEDPYLAARMGEAWVKRLQAKGVLASTKHFALNNQEVERDSIDVRVSERAMHEIYLPAFEVAVRAGTWTVMAAYNRINGQHASENTYLLNRTLKERWGFKGFVVSDWGATHSTVAAALGGLDVEMPDGANFGGGKLQEAVASGKVPMAVIDDKVRRILNVLLISGTFDRKASNRPPLSAIGSPDHRAASLRMAQEGIVLLKNSGVLPLGEIRSVAVIGPNASEYRAGGGSSMVPPEHKVTCLAGLRERLGEHAQVYHTMGVPLAGELHWLESDWLTPPPGIAPGSPHGLYAEYFNNQTLQGRPFATQVDPQVDFIWGDGAPLPGVPANSFSVRWTGRLRVPKSGNYELVTRADDGVRLWLDGKLLIDDWSDHAPTARTARLPLEAGQDHDLRIEYYQNGGAAQIELGRSTSDDADIPAAVALAAKADAAVVFVGYSDQLEGEALDRPSLKLPDGQDELIEAVAGANRNVIVVIQSGSPVLLGSWKDKVGAILQAWYPGGEGGLAVADVLLGRVNPSGRLPVTWPKRWEDCSAFGFYPGTGENGHVDYDEGVFVGYRHFDQRGIVPEYPFGHGLSYTTFTYSDLAVELHDALVTSPRVSVTVSVKNTGARSGAEIVQLYVGAKAPRAPRPPQELKGFQRIELIPGETRRITFELSRRSFARYDEGLHDWTVDPGAFELRVGSSSRDIRLGGEAVLVSP